MFLDLQYNEKKTDQSKLSNCLNIISGLFIAIVSSMLVFSIVKTDKANPQLANQAMENLPNSGVENPVTAVLLNFRSYDTLLEIAVLLIVAFAMLPSENEKKLLLSIDHKKPFDPVLVGLLRWLVPLSVLISGYLLWTGSYAPGGAFQAAAVLASAGVALSLAGQHRFIWNSLSSRILINVGLFIFMLVAAFSAILTGKTLQYPASYAGQLILFIEFAATLSIAAILLLLYTRLATGER